MALVLVSIYVVSEKYTSREYEGRLSPRRGGVGARRGSVAIVLPVILSADLAWIMQLEHWHGLCIIIGFRESHFSPYRI